MKLKGEFEFPERRSIRKEIPVSELRFRMSRRQLIRQSILSVILLGLPVGSFFLEVDAGLQWGMLGMAAFFVVFLFLFAGFSGFSEELDAEKYYSRGTLIFAGIFWLALITGIGVMMYIGFPRP
jgi:hypothetical protein